MKKKKSSKSSGVYRDLNLLVILEGAKFPGRCAICNKPADGEPLYCTFERKRAKYVEVAAVQSIATAASDLMTGSRYTGPVDAVVPLCGWHRGRRIRLALIGLGVLALSIAFIAIQKAMGAVIVPPGEMGFLNIAIYNYIAFGLIFAGFTMTMMSMFDSQNLWFKATKYNGRYVWVKGAGRDFLRELPKVEERYKEPSSGSGAGSTSDDGELTAEELIRRANLRE